MISRARSAFFNIKPGISIVGQVSGFTGGLFYLNDRLEQDEKTELAKANPGCEIERVRGKCEYKKYGRYSCYTWAVIKPDEPLQKPMAKVKAPIIPTSNQEEKKEHGVASLPPISC